jgi:ribosomal protein L3 glutamine methyltransferase
MLIEEYVEFTVSRFSESDLHYGHGTGTALDEAVYLIYVTLGLEFDQDFRESNRTISESEISLLNQRVEQRVSERRPVAYIVGEAWFCGQPYTIDERALIPRSPIAELIQQRFAPLLQSTPGRILDLCCGSGCIGIACALEFEATEVDLADLSSESLELAKINMHRHGTFDRVHAIQSDVFSNLSGQRYDLVVSNPPYVSEQEVESLPAEFGHEPRMGLVSGEDGLAIPLKILRECHQHLHPDGVLILEVGYSAGALAERLPEVPFLWLEFAEGGEGVFAITAKDLGRYRDYLN